MLEVIINFLSVLIILVGVIFIYDARIITDNIFGFGDQNEAAKGMKILGVLMSIIGILMMFFAK